MSLTMVKCKTEKRRKNGIKGKKVTQTNKCVELIFSIIKLLFAINDDTITQPAFICSNSTRETPKPLLNLFKVNNKNTRTMLVSHFVLVFPLLKSNK